MSTLSQIWNLSIGEIQRFLSENDQDVYGISDTQLYLLSFDLSKDQLSTNEIKIIEDPVFQNLMYKNEKIPHNQRLKYVLQQYNQVKQNQRITSQPLLEKNIQVGQKIKRNPKCERNDFDENNVPIDGVTFDPIPENEIYVLNQRCYNVETIRQILRTNGEDPFSREKIPENVYNELISSDRNLSLKFVEEFTQLTKTMLADNYFSNNKSKYRDWMLDPPIFNENKKSIEICSNLVEDILNVINNIDSIDSKISRRSSVLAIATAITAMTFFAGQITNLTLILSVLGARVGGIALGIQLNSTEDRNEMLKVNELFQDYINCVNNVYMV